jgi:hypothetical protein
VAGLTAGASAPPWLVEAVLAEIGQVTVVERETVQFTRARRGAPTVRLLGRITGPTDAT